MSHDIIKRLLEMVAEAQPSFSEDCALQIEQQIRHEFGGEQVTIAKRAPMLKRAREKVRAEIGTKSMPQIAAEHHGVSRRTLYRWISAKKSKP